MELDQDKKRKTSSKMYTLACVMIASTISILMGYDTGVMSGAMIFIKEDLKTNDTQIEILAGILNLCALFGSMTAGPTSDRIGRRYTIALSSLIFLIGSILMGIGLSYSMLLTGRCIAGIGVGFALMIAPVYSVEISSPSSRGFLASLPDVCISFGILLGYFSNYVFSKLTLKLGWRLMLGIAGIPSSLLIFGILIMPESPRWLVMQGRVAEAKMVLESISETPEESEVRLREIKEAAGIEENCRDVVEMPKKEKAVWKELILKPSPPVRWILVAAVGLHFFDHATGIEAIVLYSPRIFKKAGLNTKDKLLLATMGVGITKTVFIIIAMLLLDKLGRRPLLLTGTGGMIVSLTTLGFSLTIIEHSKEKVIWAVALSITSVLTFVGFFSIGLGPCAWVYSSEIFPLRLRALGMSIAVAVNRVMNSVVSMSFLSLYKAITIGGSFFLFAGISVIAWIFFYYFLPETKGKSLEEMEEVFSNGRKNVCKADGDGRNQKEIELENPHH